MSQHHSAYLAPSVSVVGDVSLAAGSSIWFGVTLNGVAGAIEIGRRSNVQDNAMLSGIPTQVLKLGHGVTIGHLATLMGCRVDDHSLIAIRAVVEPGASIGRWCLVGAGAVVPQGMQVPDGSVVMGNPARVVRRIQWRDRLVIAGTEWVYWWNARRFRSSLKSLD